MTTNKRLLAYCVELEQLAELVTGQAVHIVTAGELQLTVFAGCGGFFASDLAGIIKEKMPSRYRGPLPCVVMNDAVFSSAFDFYDRMLFNAICAHECGHVVELWDPTLPVWEPSNNAKLLEVVQAEIQVEPRLWSGHRAKPWAGHELKFLRSVCHVRYRLAVEHITADPALCFPCEYYGLQKSLLDYSKALGGEPLDRAGEPIAQILASEPPKEFSRMWSEDSRQTRPLILAASRVE